MLVLAKEVMWNHQKLLSMGGGIKMSALIERIKEGAFGNSCYTQRS